MMSPQSASKLIFSSLIFLIFANLSFAQTTPPVSHWSGTYDRVAEDGGPTFDWTFDPIQTSDGGYISAGWTSMETLADGDLVPALTKVDAHGVEQWNIGYDDGKPKQGGELGEVVEIANGYAAIGHKAEIADGPSRIFFIKVDENGSLLPNMPKYIGSDSEPNASFTGRSMKNDPSGGFIVAGGVTGHPDSIGEFDMLLMRLDNDGNVLWEKIFGGVKTDQAFAVTALYSGGTQPDGTGIGSHIGYALAGYLGVNTAGNEAEAYVVRTDLFGNVVWEEYYNSPAKPSSFYTYFEPGPSVCETLVPSNNSRDRIYELVQLANGNLLAGASYNHHLLNNSVGHECALTLPSGEEVEWEFYATGDAVLLEIALSDGTALMEKQVAQFTGADFQVAVRQDYDLNYVVLGTTANDAIKVGDVNSMYLLKIDQNGDRLWAKTFVDHSCGFGLAVAGGGGYILVGNNSEHVPGPIGGSHNDDGLFVKVYGDCQPNIPDGDFTIPNGLIISNGQDIFWTADQQVKGEVIVESGGTLFIVNSNVRFADTRQLYDFDATGVSPTTIRVEPGGFLFIANSNLSGLNECGREYMWEGLQVEGVGFLPQIPTSNQGKVSISGSSINNAITGIRVGKTIYIGGHAISGNGQGGGIVQATNSFFVGNKRGVEFNPYTSPTTPALNFSTFSGCTFSSFGELVDPDFVDDEGNRIGTEEFVFLWDVHGVRFRSNTFSDFSSFEPNLRATGIRSFDASYKLTSNCTDPNTQPCQTFAPNQFNNLFYGIKAQSSTPFNTLSVDRAQFIDVFRGIYLIGIDYPVITRSIFNMSSPVFPSYGLYIREGTGYQVEENSFNGDVNAFFTYGTGFYNTQVNNNVNELYNNEHNGLSVGTFAARENSGSGPIEGLKVKCNDYFAGNYDIAVTSPPGISEQQGAPFDETTPAGNLFDGCSFTDGEIYNLFSDDFTYWHHAFTPGFITKPTVGCFTPFPKVDLGEAFDLYSPTNSCPSKISTGTTTLGVVKSLITQWEVETDNLQELLTTGNDPALFIPINLNKPPGQVKNVLLAASPYLSNDVLKAAISQKPTPLPPGVLKEILLANAPLDDDLLNILSSRFPKLPNGVMNQINAAQIGVSERDKLEANIANAKTERELAVSGLIRYYLHRDTLDGMDSVIAILKQEDRIGAKCRLAAAHTAKRQFVEAREVLKKIRQEDTKADGFCDLQEILIELAEVQQTCFKMLSDPPLEARMKVVAADETRSGCLKASTLLALVYGLEIPEVLDVPVQQKTMFNASIEDEQAGYEWLEENHFLTSFPNPFTEYTTIEAYLPEEAKNGRIVIFNILGVKIKEYVMGPGYNTITVLGEDLPKGGVYLFNLEYDGDKVDIGRMTYIK